MNIKQLKEAIKDLPDDLVITIPPIEEGIADTALKNGYNRRQVNEIRNLDNR